MDNVTHTLIGIAAAETLATTRFKKARVPLWIASSVANNLPDLDIFFTLGRHGDKLNYLLQHRGFTHTLLLAPLQGVLWLAILRLAWWRKTDIPWNQVTALCLLGPFLHLFADSWNSYGVHPFWPIDNHWVYGDLVFIVEPWLWAIFLPIVWKRSETIYGKAISLLLLAFLLAASWSHAIVSCPAALALTLASAAWTGAQVLIRDDRWRIATAFTAVVALFGIFAWAELELKERFAGDGSEIAMLAHPANPFCWTVLAAGFQGDTYRAAAWTASPWPSLLSPASCPKLYQKETSAGLRPFTEAANEYRIPIGEFLGTRADYTEITKSCRARAFLRFARIPFWKIDGEKRHLGDLRFDRDRTLNFAEISVGGSDEACPSFEPPWIGRFFPSEI